MSEFAKRTLFGALYVVCVVGSILSNAFVYAGLFCVICLLAVDEFHRLMKSSGKIRIFAAICTLLLWIIIQCMAWRTEAGFEYLQLGLILGLAYLCVCMIALLDEIWNHSGQPLQNWGNFLIAQGMLALPLATMSFIYFLDKWLLLALFVLIWVNDSGAYCVGSLTAKRPQGNHKMSPHISPKKSWEGLLGGFAFTIAASLILWACDWYDVIVTRHSGLLIAFLFAFLVSAFGTMGDLMESLIKRSVGVKDSGMFLPGHGGVLDRFDSIILASPVIAAFCWLCYFIAPLL